MSSGCSTGGLFGTFELLHSSSDNESYCRDNKIKEKCTDNQATNSQAMDSQLTASQGNLIMPTVTRRVNPSKHHLLTLLPGLLRNQLLPLIPTIMEHPSTKMEKTMEEELCPLTLEKSLFEQV